MSRFYTITVDTEEEWDWASGYPTHGDSVRNIEALPRFQEFCDRFDARVTYFVNHAVLADEAAAATITDLARHPHVEIGFHIHPWNTPPLADADAVPARESFLHNLPRVEAIAKLDTVLQAFGHRGLAPTSFRGGRYSTCDWIQDHLYQHGCIADASVVPFTTWSDDGAPDFRHRDPLPRRRKMRGPPGTARQGTGEGQRPVSPEAPPTSQPADGSAEADSFGMWEIPLTLGFTRGRWRFWRRFYELGERPPLRQLRCIGIAERVWVRRVWLNLEHPLGESVEAFLPVVRQAELPCINFTMHSSSLVPGLNPYVRTDSDLENLYRRLETCLSQLGAWPEFQPATVTDVARQLESEFHARPGN